MMQLKFNLFEDIEREAPSTDTRDKQCTTCEEVFPETEEHFYIASTYFSKDGTSNNHLHNKCKACANKSRTTQQRLQKFHGHKAYGKCDCCGVDSKQLKGDKLHLDHCHSTGTYRGHLCGSCNRGMGMLGDNSEGVQRAVDYLKKVENK
jgi:hypothetical protein